MTTNVKLQCNIGGFNLQVSSRTGVIFSHNFL